MYRNWTCTLIFFTYLNVFLSWCFSVDVFWCFLILMFLLSGSSIVSSFQSFWVLFVLQNTIFSEREETLIVYFQMICFRLIFWEKDISLSSLSPLSLSLSLFKTLLQKSKKRCISKYSLYDKACQFSALSGKSWRSFWKKLTNYDEIRFLTLNDVFPKMTC